LYYVGLFANNFLPSGIGGDALRIYGSARISGKTTEAAASVIFERLLASLVLGLTASLALLFVSLPNSIKYQVYWCVGIIVGVCFFIPAALFCCSFRENTMAGRWLSQLSKYKATPTVLIKVLALSFLFQALMVLANVFIFSSAGINLPLAVHFLNIPVIMAVSMLPVSINGLGIREGMYIILYGYAGVDSARAVSFSLLFFIMVTLASLAGGIALLQRKW
jgi:uncharacterized membrane protein YbhN (UPF0104 family)